MARMEVYRFHGMEGMGSKALQCVHIDKVLIMEISHQYHQLF